jgi:hypothetical protein
MMDEGAWAMLIFLFGGTSYLLVEDHGWPLAILVFALEITIVVLAVKLGEARDEVRSLSYMLEQERDKSLVKWRSGKKEED